MKQQGNRFFLAAPVLLALLLSACATTPDSMSVFLPPPPTTDPAAAAEADLLVKLGMNRAPTSLGFEEKKYNPCDHGATLNCKQKFMTVVHFQLLCRDSDGTVNRAPTQFTPLRADRVSWKLGGFSGGTRTDTEGYGQLTMVSPKSTREQRLILFIGKQFLGVTAGETSRLVLPKNFCG